MDYILTIRENNKINSAFAKANCYLVRKNKQDLLTLGSDVERCLLLEKCWLTEFKAVIEKINTRDNLTTEHWKHLSFSNNSDLTLFMLRWGGS